MTTVPKTEVPLPALAVSTFLREAADPRVSHRQMIKTISGQRALNQFIKKASESPLFRKGQPAPTVLEASMQIGRRALLALCRCCSRLMDSRDLVPPGVVPKTEDKAKGINRAEIKASKDKLAVWMAGTYKEVTKVALDLVFEL